jgi:hypothetical protein
MNTITRDAVATARMRTLGIVASWGGDDYDGIVVRLLACFAAAVLAVSAPLPVLLPAPLSAHHWFNASYESGKVIQLTGVITRFDWKNPHALFYMDVVDVSTRRTTRWVMEMGSPNSLARTGWSKSSLRVGETVTVEGIPWRGGAPMGYPLSIVTEAGRHLTAAPRP